MLAAGHEALKAAIPTAAVAWAGESSHKVDGASGYLWLVMTPEVVLYEADRSRGQEVAQRRFQGFTSARQIAERQPESAEATRFHDRLSGLYGRGAAAQERPATAARNARAIIG